MWVKCRRHKHTHTHSVLTHEEETESRQFVRACTHKHTNIARTCVALEAGQVSWS